MGFLIDTDVLIAAERKLITLRPPNEDLGSETLALAAITASELLHGVYRAQTISERERRSQFIEAVLSEFQVIPFDIEVARIHARLWADLERSGQRIGSHDLMIAATALMLGFGVITLNVREFQRIPNLRLVEPQQLTDQ